MNLESKMRGLTLGAQVLPLERVSASDLGALAPLVGTWKNVDVPASDISAGWNTISVPGQDKGFVFEVIPYTETLTFNPVVIQAGNRGPVVKGQQVEQMIFGLLYEQQIISACESSFCNERGFPAGSTIHVETGLFLNLGQPNGGYTIARMSTIPHGNSLLALGSSSEKGTPGTDFFSPASSIPTLLNGERIVQLGYSDQITGKPQFAPFNQVNPNAFLESTLQGLVGTGGVSNMTVIQMSTDTPDANGGILNIPFIQTNVNATKMDATFWIEDIVDSEGNPSQILQYSQTINLVFPATGSAQPINWPHVTVNSMVKVPETMQLQQKFQSLDVMEGLDVTQGLTES
ncbi:heme-binding protein [Chryseobacterium polytrichastri]|uniref:Uncharacterized protein n=1 Tax=Chryseobacterium polytrichastri TaxID=1302687 RepID=A0A1M7FG53_9FLAO|nr:heme-binding protein [Chryseobacterium polytrichastri]SHM03051.1 hypothetical protein SAMN05444267_10323 [Chryseobacterium polytrichastri]